MNIRFLKDITVYGVSYKQGHTMETSDPVLTELAKDHNGPLGAAVQNLDHPDLLVPAVDEFDASVEYGSNEEGGSD